MPDDAQICGCNGVSKGRICAAIQAKELTTLDEVRAHTKASASCGQCTGKVEALLAHLGGAVAANARQAGDVQMHRCSATTRSAARSPTQELKTIGRCAKRSAGRRRTAARNAGRR